MDYSKRSDFEINKMVAELQSLIINEQQGASLKASSSSVLVNCITESWEFNPCNNPSDAWPIIVDNEISVGVWNRDEYNPFKWCAEDKYGRCRSEWTEENPLRAAMIVYLMMKESNNA